MPVWHFGEAVSMLQWRSSWHERRGQGCRGVLSCRRDRLVSVRVGGVDHRCRARNRCRCIVPVLFLPRG